MSKILEELEEIVGKGRIKRDEPMDLHTAQKIGGIAEYYIEVEKLDELIKIVRHARNLGVALLVFGSGSRVKMPEQGVAGLLIKNNCRRFDKASMKGKIRDNQVGVQEVLVSAEAGVPMNQLVRFSIEEGLEGLEYQLGMPGTVGGALYTNAKYAPKNIYARSHLFSLSLLDKTGEVQSFTKDLPHFLFTDDEFAETEEVILSAVFKLLPYDKKILWQRGREAVEYRSGQNG